MTPMTSDSRAFWNDHYDGPAVTTPPRPNPTLVHCVEQLDLTGATALELACGRGGDALWLAGRGWQVTATDVSDVVLAAVTRHAAHLEVAERLTTQRHDLAEAAPHGGPWDLVYACFFHSFGDTDRDVAVRLAAEQVTDGGVLLLVDHASSAPWSWEQRDDHPLPEQSWTALALPEPWTPVLLEQRVRTAVGPAGEQAEVTDNVIAVRRGV